MSYNYLFKYIIVGNSTVGKSSILLRFINDNFNPHIDMTIGVEFGSKLIKVKNKDIKLQIWDTSGQELFRSITKAYYRSSIGGLLVYDITSRDSFDKLDMWYNEIKEQESKCELILVGNKSDLNNKRDVTKKEGMEYAKLRNMEYIETSANSNNNIKEVFMKLTKQIMNKIINGEIDYIEPTYGIKIVNNNIVYDDSDSENNNDDNYCGQMINNNRFKCC